MKISIMIILILSLTYSLCLDRIKKLSNKLKIQNKLSYEFLDTSFKISTNAGSSYSEWYNDFYLFTKEIDLETPKDQIYYKGIPFQFTNLDYASQISKRINPIKFISIQIDSKTVINILPFCQIYTIICDDSNWNSLYTGRENLYIRIWYNNDGDECKRVAGMLRERREKRRTEISTASSNVSTLAQNYVSGSMYGKIYLSIDDYQKKITDEENNITNCKNLDTTLQENKRTANIELEKAKSEVKTILTNINTLNTNISTNEETIKNLEKSKSDKSITKSTFEDLAKKAKENFSSAINELQADTPYDKDVIENLKKCLEKKDIKECNFDKLLPL